VSSLIASDFANARLIEGDLQVFVTFSHMIVAG